MYDTWNVAFDTTNKNRSPCDRLCRPNILISGAVGCPDVFSDAFSAALNIELEPANLDMNLDFLDFDSSATAVSDTLSSSFWSNSTPPTEADGGQQWHFPAPALTELPPPHIQEPGQRSFISTPDVWVLHDPAVPPGALAELSRIKSEDRNAHLLRVGALEPVPAYGIPMASPAQNTPALAFTEHYQAPPPTLSQVPQTSSLLPTPSSPVRRPKRRSMPSHPAASRAASKRSRKYKKASHKRLEDDCFSLRECIDVKAEEVSGLAMEVTLLKQEVWKCAHCHHRYLAALQARGETNA